MHGTKLKELIAWAELQNLDVDVGRDKKGTLQYLDIREETLLHTSFEYNATHKTLSVIMPTATPSLSKKVETYLNSYGCTEVQALSSLYQLYNLIDLSIGSIKEIIIYVLSLDCEPVIEELSEGVLLVLDKTSLDKLNKSIETYGILQENHKAHFLIVLAALHYIKGGTLIYDFYPYLGLSAELQEKALNLIRPYMYIKH